MGTSKTGCSVSITKEDLNNMYKQGFVEGYMKSQAGIERALERLEGCAEAYSTSIDAYRNGKHSAYNYAIEIIKEEVG